MLIVFFLLENGEIVESGNHDDLMKLDGKYKQLFDLHPRLVIYYKN